ncbi:ankyrin repeat domain-containing protein [Curtobacterium sp. MCBD17_032]|uniref:ankyrin repeat domain-containing protein n=1 Tax=Curtobacterium sp. MCBD17_032 TaxID=2175659 RepID=UPI000DA717B2|nr:ankyrin repeat domain-containing protein [Curtobacterium sp. MCBD17_032]PZE86190.1 hypothetical protein DEI91_03520 [Curtobacterium sp. MCBD17_032]
MRWSHVNWPSVGYVSLEDVDGYRDHLARLVLDAPPTVAALASVQWREAEFVAWEPEGDTLRAVLVTRNDEVLDTPEGLWRRWNHARVTLRFGGVALDPPDTEPLDLLAGDVHVLRGELAHVGDAGWELRLLVSPTGEVVIVFVDVAVEVRSVDESVRTDLEARPAHGWHGPLADGWLEWATPAVRAAGHGDVGGLAMALDGFACEPADVDEVDQRWGFAPLHAAAWFDRADAAAVLLTRGARPDLADAEGRTPLVLAEERGARQVAALLADAADGPSHDRDDGTTDEGP